VILANAIVAINRVLTMVVGLGAMLFLTFSAQIAVWASDRDAPFVVLDYHADPAKPGDTTTIKGMVRRDLKRSCSVLYSRMFIDSQGSQYELTPGVQLMNSRALTALNQRSPDLLSLSITILPKAAKGGGTAMSTLSYRCNPVHQFYPISMVVTFNVEVL
jgi:hypothetical protein